MRESPKKNSDEQEEEEATVISRSLIKHEHIHQRTSLFPTQY